jgi:hypothetical protein
MPSLAFEGILGRFSGRRSSQLLVNLAGARLMHPVTTTTLNPGTLAANPAMAKRTPGRIPSGKHGIPITSRVVVFPFHDARLLPPDQLSQLALQLGRPTPLQLSDFDGQLVSGIVVAAFGNPLAKRRQDVIQGDCVSLEVPP